MTVLEQEKVQYTDDGLEAIIFTAQGDMRQVRVAAATSWARAPGPRGKQGPGGEGEEPGRGRGRAANLPPRALVPPQALNNLQSTFSGFGFINSENVFKVQEPVGPPGVLHLGVATAGCAGAPAPGVRVPSPRADSGGCRARPRTWGGGFGRSPTPGPPRGPSCGPARRGSQHLVAKDAGFRCAPPDHMVRLLEGER